jgi:hypothetical protein
MYLPAPNGAGPAKGALMKGGLPVTLEVTEEILQEFMDAMSSLESHVSSRWKSSEVWVSDLSAE